MKKQVQTALRWSTTLIFFGVVSVVNEQTASAEITTREKSFKINTTISGSPKSSAAAAKAETGVVTKAKLQKVADKWCEKKKPGPAWTTKKPSKYTVQKRKKKKKDENGKEIEVLVNKVDVSIEEKDSTTTNREVIDEGVKILNSLNPFKKVTGKIKKTSKVKTFTKKVKVYLNITCRWWMETSSFEEEEDLDQDDGLGSEDSEEEADLDGDGESLYSEDDGTSFSSQVGEIEYYIDESNGEIFEVIVVAYNSVSFETNEFDDLLLDYADIETADAYFEVEEPSFEEQMLYMEAPQEPYFEGAEEPYMPEMY